MLRIVFLYQFRLRSRLILFFTEVSFFEQQFFLITKIIFLY